MSVEKLIGKGGPRFWFKENEPEPQKQPEEKRDDQPVAEEASDESTTEDDPVTEVETPGMSEVDPGEIETGQKTWMNEKITSLETENQELKVALQEMEARLASQENAMRQVAEGFMAMEAAIGQITERARRQDNVVESSRTSIQSLADEVESTATTSRKSG